MTLTAAQIRCLLAILSLTCMHEEVASKNVAKLMGVSRPSVHKMLEILIREGLLEKEHYGAARLTAEGQRLAEELQERQERLMLMFARQYGLDMDESSLAATLLMSGLKKESLEKLCPMERECP